MTFKPYIRAQHQAQTAHAGAAVAGKSGADARDAAAASATAAAALVAEEAASDAVEAAAVDAAERETAAELAHDLEDIAAGMGMTDLALEEEASLRGAQSSSFSAELLRRQLAATQAELASNLSTLARGSKAALDGRLAAKQGQRGPPVGADSEASVAAVAATAAAVDAATAAAVAVAAAEDAAIAAAAEEAHPPPPTPAAEAEAAVVIENALRAAHDGADDMLAAGIAAVRATAAAGRQRRRIRSPLDQPLVDSLKRDDDHDHNWVLHARLVNISFPAP